MVTTFAVSEEETLVAELELLGICYLSRQTSYRAEQVRPPAQLIADLARQPSARVREALISVFLAHPQYAGAVFPALARLSDVIFRPIMGHGFSPTWARHFHPRWATRFSPKLVHG
jgi:hypothetical protein